MQFTTLTSLAIAVLGVSAGTVNKRNGEGVHLANCLQNSNLGPIPYSMVIYYADDADASRNVRPSTNDECAITRPGQGGWKTWEGSSISCTFPTNTYFTSNIQSGAGGYSVGQYAGPGDNNYHHFNCYRDNEHILFDDGRNSCRSIYYCLDA